MIYKVKVTTKKVARKVGYFSVALLLSSTAWNRYIAYYQDILEKNDVTVQQFEKQNFVIKVRKLKVFEISEILMFEIFSRLCSSLSLTFGELSTSMRCFISSF